MTPCRPGSGEGAGLSPIGHGLQSASGYYSARYAAHATRRFRLQTNVLKKAEFYRTNGH